ncbi:hypothetical protein [Helicobacter sp. 13S00477-4]|uniref:hypothetical protein n=1 Tax=Helicobacter sp. 13S00477-4 TaxID=1905759 RepID=UPI000BA5D376|nr:hypothetical protein [Helicobacter sp. 13S00477-4]PAF52519.1 hypothetical protein BKH44_01695 [Helicobacter sp. 13S00477-4]
MLEQIASIAHLNTLSSELKGDISFNATLPLLLKVLGKDKNGEYILTLGNKTIRTKSHKELLIGQKYWANMSRSSVGAIILSDLIRQPKMIEVIEKSPLKFILSDLEKILKESKKEPLEAYKDFLIDKFANAQNRYDFLNLGNLLLSLHKNVLSFVISDSNKDGLIQIKPSKFKKQSLEFYAIYPHLGPLEGKVYLNDSGVSAWIYVSYESVKKILERHKGELSGFDSVNIEVKKSIIEPLFEFEEGLLDVKG